MIAFLSLFVTLIALSNYFSDRLFENEPFHILISAKAVEQNSNQSDSSANQGSIHDSNDNSQNQSPGTENQDNSGLPSEDKPNVDSKSDPSQLKAILVGDTGKRHDLILFRYTTSEGSVSPSGANYPKKPRITLDSGEKVNLLSGNQNFRVVVYSMSLDLQNENGNNKKNNQNVYVEKKGSKFVIPDVISGTYHLYIKTEYTPSDDDTAYFVDTVKIVNRGDTEKQSQSNSKGKVGSEVAEVESKKEVTQQHRMQMNVSVQMTPFNQTLPSDIVFKVIANSNQSQIRDNKLSIPVLSQSTPLNITLMATSLNQTHPENKIVKGINTLSQPILLQDNKTIEAVQLNQTKPEDMILQLNASNLTMIQMPITLQFVPINQSVYKIEVLPANQTVTG